MARSSTTHEMIRHTTEGPLRHSQRYLEDRPGIVSGVHVRKGVFDYEHLRRHLRDDIAFARAHAAVVDASKEVWDRAAAITEEGKFLVERLEGFIQRNQLSLDIRTELDDAADRLDGVEGRVTVVEADIKTLEGEIVLKASQSDLDALEGRVTDAEAAIVTNANQIALRVLKSEFDVLAGQVSTNAANITVLSNSITSEVARIEGNLNSPNPSVWYSSVKQTSDEIQSVVSKLNMTPDNPNWDSLQFSSIKQAVDSIESTVTTLNLDADHPDQYTSIKQTATEINSYVMALNNSPYDLGNFSSFSQTANAITSIVAKLEGNPDDANQYSVITQLLDEIDLRVVKDEVVSAINLSPEGVRILGERIQLDGDVYIDGTFTVGEANIGNLSVSTLKLKDDAVTVGKLNKIQDHGVVFSSWSEAFGLTSITGGKSFVFPQQVVTTSTFPYLASVPYVRARVHSKYTDKNTNTIDDWESDWSLWHAVGTRTINDRDREGLTAVRWASDYFYFVGQHDPGFFASHPVDYWVYVFIDVFELGRFRVQPAVVFRTHDDLDSRFEYEFRVEIEWVRWGVSE